MDVLVPVERWVLREARDIKVGDVVRGDWGHPFVVKAVRDAAAGTLVELSDGGRWQPFRPTEELDLLTVEHVAEDEVWCGDCGRVLVLDRRGHPTRCDFCDGKDASL